MANDELHEPGRSEDDEAENCETPAGAQPAAVVEDIMDCDWQMSLRMKELYQSGRLG